MRKDSRREGVVVALDLASTKAYAMGTDARTGEVVVDGEFPLTDTGLRRLARHWQQHAELSEDVPEELPLVVMEAGCNSAMLQRRFEAMGCEVWVVASDSVSGTRGGRRRKTDLNDAAQLLQIAVATPGSLRRVHHRSEQQQQDLDLIRARNHLVRMRTSAVNHVRGLFRGRGDALPRKQASRLHVWSEPHVEKLPPEARATVEPHLRVLETLSAQIAEVEAHIEKVIAARYPVVERLREVPGVGPILSAAFVTVVGDPARFRKSRDVGAYLGLVPARYQSGDTDPQLGIDKRGDQLLRWLLVQSAQWLLRKNGPESDLRDWGLKLCERGGKRARKRAVVAVARKLAVLLHRLWVSGERYDPRYKSRQRSAMELAVAN